MYLCQVFYTLASSLPTPRYVHVISSALQIRTLEFRQINNWDKVTLLVSGRGRRWALNCGAE